MAKYTVPKNVGRCFVLTGLTGKWTVANDKRGKDSVYIPCKTRREAEALCDRLNRGDHNGTVSVPNHS